MPEYGSIPPGAFPVDPALGCNGTTTPPFLDQHDECPDEDQLLIYKHDPIDDPGHHGGNGIIIITCISCATLISCFLGGLVTVATPQIAMDLDLDPGVALWPISMYALANGCTLLISGSLSDVVGSREIFLLGCFLQSIFSMACGLSQTGPQLIFFRILSGLATSLCLPSAVSLITENFLPGQLRNLAFALMGGGQPIGFGIGLTLGGVFADTLGWPWGFHTVAIINTVVLFLGIWQLPTKDKYAPPISWKRVAFGIDWIGALTASPSLALLSYVLASITDDASNISSPINALLLSLSALLIIVFVFWVGRQERRGRPALIKNSLWSNKAFTSISINVFLIWGAFNAFEQMLNYFFQEVQGHSALETAWRFLPTPISGSLSSIVTGLVLHRIRADWIINATTVVSSLSPFLMALVDPKWSYWVCAFPAIFLNSIGADSLFTVSNIVIASVFPTETQGLAGGVFNTVSQIGKSVGLALVALIANSVTENSVFEDKSSPEALLEGYRAAFWFLFALSVTSLSVSVWGLRKVGRVGRGREHG
ncbi:hypothetical protein FGG08_003859 [Glutinoglossum americanum]|uniref:Major facilitator superfamily (MFS) profile domain-containing protein n=1 Tax=Glutinoglossum americanum TaxID=1670608 RepID=A0A9P8I6A3_9PEZI|nr:hypothetical protein FGG08_003859 [Glutinoglossum americanum]